MKRNELEAYRKLLLFLRKEGYQVWNFRTFLSSREAALPERLVVLRHDIHHRDIAGGYKMLEMEQALVGATSTPFVQYHFNPIQAKEREYETQEARQRDYRNFIEYCRDTNVDVQPHISPYSMYYTADREFLRKEAADSFKERFQEHYRVVIAKDRFGRELGEQVTVIREDIFEFEQLRKAVVEGILDQKKLWEGTFGLTPICYSAHGESSISSIFRYDSAFLLDNMTIQHANAYPYSANSRRVREVLDWVSDDSWYYRPEEFVNFSQAINPKGEFERRIQLLIHPGGWFAE